MRLSLSRRDVDLLLVSLELKRGSLVRPSDKLVSRLLHLRDKLIVFRAGVWTSEYKEV